MPTNSAVAQAPWYRQFWPWFLLVLPATALVAGLTTLGIALRHGDTPIADDYIKHGMAVERQGDRGAAALQRQLRARVALDANGQVTATLRGALQPRPAILRARFVHPFDAQWDFTVTLADTGAAYAGALPGAARGRWTIELSDPAASWLLRAPIDTRASASVDLSP